MNFLAKNFPKVHQVFNQFKQGSIQLYKDGKTTLTLQPKKGEMYRPNELITHHEFATDIKRILPVFIVFWIPIIGQWTALPLVLLFPRQTLSRQFWTDEQRVVALDHHLVQRVKAFPNLADSLLESIDNSKLDHKLSQIGCDVIEKIENGGLFQQEEARLFQMLFRGAKNLTLDNLSRAHEKNLLLSWNTQDLYRQAVYLSNVDRSLVHFGVDEQTKHIIDMVCHQRGLHLGKRTIEESRLFVKQWLFLSEHLKSKDARLAFLLHLPMLMRNNFKVEETEK